MSDIGIIKFQLGGINFCINADQILEIVRYHGVRKIPAPLPYVVGLIELRHYIVVVVDFRKRLGLSPILLSRDTVMIVTRLSSGMTGVLVEAISDFRRIPEERILPPISVAGFPEQLLSGVLAESDDILLMPNLDKIFSSYINIRLVPISLSEKIAFQYRFTPGALTRTLENNLRSQQAIDSKTVRDLPRAICLAPVLVHKMTSYYSDFRPQTLSGERKDQSAASFQTLRAGDAQYQSLSRQFSTQHKTSAPDNAETDQQASVAAMINTLMPDPHPPLPELLEGLLHRGDDISFSSESQTETFTSQPDTGRSLAKTLRIPTTRMRKYFTYHTPRGSVQRMKASPDRIRLLSWIRPSTEARLQELLTRNQPAKGEDAFPYLLKTLQTLHDERYVLTPQHLRQLRGYYQITPGRIAKLVSFFPEYAFILEARVTPEEPIEKVPPQADSSEDQEAQEPLTLELPSTSVSECLWYLTQANQLSDQRTARQVASQMRISTCRLSKLSSYYIFEAVGSKE